MRLPIGRLSLLCRCRIIFLSLVFWVMSWFPLPLFFQLQDTEAVVVRRTPAKTHRVVRQTTRRTVRRVKVGTRISVLPRGCTTIRKSGRVYYLCDGAYYLPYYEGTTLVYVVVDAP